MEALADSIEGVFNEIGFGRWQGLVLFVSLVYHAVAPVQQLGATLLSAPVPFRCLYQEDLIILSANVTKSTRGVDVNDEYNINNNNNTYNLEAMEFPSLCLPEVNNTIPLGKMFEYDVLKSSLLGHATGMPSCPYIEYDTSIFESTVISEWDFVCERSSYRPLFQMTFPIGSLVGSLFCGQLSDWLGRKRLIQMGSLLMVSAIVGTCLCPWYWMVVALRILAGVGHNFILFPVYTLISEISASSSRTMNTMVPGISYFLAMIMFSGVAYVIPQWRMLFAVCHTPLLLVVPLSFIIDESPRWLLQNGRTTEAVEILKKGAAQNKVTFTKATSDFLEKISKMNGNMAVEGTVGSKKEDNNSQGTLKILWACLKGPGMRVIAIATPFLWLLKRCLYIGIVLNANNFTSSNPFIYVALTAVMGIVGVILSMPFSLKFPRKGLLGGAFSISGILVILDLFVPAEYWWIKWPMVLSAFCLACGAFQLNYVYTAELFPTVIRTRGFTLNNLVGAIGEMAMPLVTDIAVQYQWWTANVTFGLAGIGGSLILPLLPETMGEPLPESLKDVEDRFWKISKGLHKDTEAIKNMENGKTTYSV